MKTNTLIAVLLIIIATAILFLPSTDARIVRAPRSHGGAPTQAERANERMDERFRRQQEDRKARAQSRIARSQEKSQELLSNRRITVLENRIRDLEYIIMPCPVLPAEIADSEDVKLYELAHRKLQRDAAARLAAATVKRVSTIAGIKPQAKPAKTIEEKTYDILLETFLQQKHRRRHLQ